ncbi:DnaJ domain-containing protein [Chytridium lagenaria]|nr:DnaJ domain-containing protein [Chytridium lagenaria]
MSLYDVLGVTPDASMEEIKKSFHGLLLELHPDKNATSSNSEVMQSRLQQVLKAWETLKDPSLKADYDRQVTSAKRRKRWSKRLILMTWKYDPTTSTFFSECRCSGKYIISETELENGVNMVCCTHCSIHVLVQYEIVVS